jgi:hypothetical protein
VSTCHQANLSHKISTHQIVATSSIDDGLNATIFDDEEILEQVMSLKLLGMVHVGSQNLLHDIGFVVVLGRMLVPRDMCIVVIVR